MIRFSDLSEQEILALAISSEEEDSKIYRGFAQGLREQYPASAKVFDKMADEEVRHRTMLFDLYRSQAQATLANPATRPRRGTKICRDHGARMGKVLSQGRAVGA